MRISDWSSDVCSSDLTNRVRSEVPGSTLILMRSRPGEMMMFENRSKTFHLSLHIDSFIAQSRYPDDYQNLMAQERRDSTPAVARTFLAQENTKGRIVLPCSSTCGNPSKQREIGYATVRTPGTNAHTVSS